MAPTHLGSYPVEREIGRGGMGVVYLARDPRLDRAVAIKVVPTALAQNPDNLARFEREAKLLAAVNHPNIAAIYGVEDADGQRLLVMEYVPGETLGERLSRAPMAVGEALEICRQIAAAIEAAHEGGIIHRDLKPGNVKVAPDDTVKVLDFGLAKGGAASSADIAQSPTLTYSPTAIGVILGTAGYMSPEQARGKPVDRRADIWAFGCVLFECLTGRKTFEADTVSDTIARVIEREPAWDALPVSTPPRIRELIRRCLEKDVKRRQRDMGDVRIEIEEVIALKSSMRLPAADDATPAGTGAWKRWASAAALLGLGALLGIAAWKFAGAGAAVPVRTPVSLSVSIPQTIRATAIRFAKDSDTLLVAGYPKRLDGTEDRQQRIYARRLDSYDLRPIPSTENIGYYSRSPDGRWLAVVTAVGDTVERRVVKVPVDGGSPPIPLIDWQDDWFDVTWISDGDIVIQTADRGKFFRLPSGGGDPKPTVTVTLDGKPAGRVSLGNEVPGKGLLATRESWGPRGYQQDILLIDAVSGQARVLVLNGGNPQFLPDTGHLLYSTGPALMAVSLDPATAVPRGEPVALFQDLRSNSWSNGEFHVSRTGHLVYAPGGRLGTDRQIVVLSVNGETTPYLTDARSYEDSLSVTPDGRQVAVVIPNARGTYEVWTATADRPGVRKTIALPNADAGAATWSPNGRWIAFNRFRNDAEDGVYIQEVDPPGARKAIIKNGGGDQQYWAAGWTDKGDEILMERKIKGRTDIVAVPMSAAGEPGQLREVRATPATETWPTASADGRLLAFTSDESGKHELYVSALNGGRLTGPPLQITNGGGDDPHWFRDSRTLFFRSADDQRIMKVTVDTAGSLRASAPVTAFNLRSARIDPGAWDILPGGQLIGVQGGAGEDIVTSYNVVLNWLDQIRSRLPR